MPVTPPLAVALDAKLLVDPGICVLSLAGTWGVLPSGGTGWAPQGQPASPCFLPGTECGLWADTGSPSCAQVCRERVLGVSGLRGQWRVLREKPAWPPSGHLSPLIPECSGRLLSCAEVAILLA